MGVYLTARILYQIHDVDRWFAFLFPGYHLSIVIITILSRRQEANFVLIDSIFTSHVVAVVVMALSLISWRVVVCKERVVIIK